MGGRIFVGLGVLFVVVVVYISFFSLNPETFGNLLSLQATKLHFLHITEASKKSKGGKYCANTVGDGTQANKLFWWKVSTRQ